MPAPQGLGALSVRSCSLLPTLRMRGRRGSAPVSSTGDGEAYEVSEGASTPPGPSSPHGGVADRASARTLDAFDTAFIVTPPPARRPQLSTPRRIKAIFTSSPGSPTHSAATADSGHDAVCAVRLQDLVSKLQLETLAFTEGWHLAWSHEHELGDFAPEPPAPGAEAVLVVHEKGHMAATARLVQSFAQHGAPVFVLLFDACGAAPEDFGVATAAQHELLREGAEDVLCTARTVRELRLAVAMALHRRAAKLDEMSRMRAEFAKEADRSGAERLRELEEVQSTGIFWQSVDRLCKGFPAMDLRLPRVLEAGAQIGPCILDCSLGQGRYSKVYGATNERSGSREAIKAIAKTQIKHCAHATALFREIDLQRRLEHRHIAKLLGVLHGPMHVFVHMEEASRTNLFMMMQSVSGSLPLEDAKRFQGQLADAVAYCHAQGVAHRDLKPENIALDESGLDIKLVDFGCCVRAECWRSDVVGSLAFMAPEILIAADDAPYRASCVDVWASGVILVEMLLGVSHLSRRLGWGHDMRIGPARHGELVRYFSDESFVQRLLRRRFGDADSGELEGLLLGMFEVAPEKRWSAERVAASSWLFTR